MQYLENCYEVIFILEYLNWWCAIHSTSISISDAEFHEYDTSSKVNEDFWSKLQNDWESLAKKDKDAHPWLKPPENYEIENMFDVSVFSVEHAKLSLL